MIDGWPRRELCSKEGENRLIINVTTVLPLRGFVGDDAVTFRGQRNHSMTSHWHQEARNGKTAP